MYVAPLAQQILSKMVQEAVNFLGFEVSGMLDFRKEAQLLGMFDVRREAELLGFGVAPRFGASSAASGDDGLGQSELRAAGPSGEEDGEGTLCC